MLILCYCTTNDAGTILNDGSSELIALGGQGISCYPPTKNPDFGGYFRLPDQVPYAAVIGGTRRAGGSQVRMTFDGSRKFVSTPD